MFLMKTLKLCPEDRQLYKREESEPIPAFKSNNRQLFSFCPVAEYDPLPPKMEYLKFLETSSLFYLLTHLW